MFKVNNKDTQTTSMMSFQFPYSSKVKIIYLKIWWISWRCYSILHEFAKSRPWVSCPREYRGSHAFWWVCALVGENVFLAGQNFFLWVNFFFSWIIIFSPRSKFFLVGQICFSWVEYISHWSDFSSHGSKFFSCFIFCVKTKSFFRGITRVISIDQIKVSGQVKVRKIKSFDNINSCHTHVFWIFNYKK